MELTEEEKKEIRKELVDDIEKNINLVQSGYAGINHIGNIVDRRIIHDATPLQENALLGIPKPKEL